MTGIGKSDIGRIRAGNEDSIFVQNSEIGALKNLYIVADGMGGHKSGEIASSNAVKFFTEFISENLNTDEILDSLVEGVLYANKKVNELSRTKFEYSNMGTTFLAASFDDEKIYVAHVGDSRLYIVRNEEIKQITTDHSYVMDMVRSGIITKEEAKTHPDRNIITRALGIDPNVSIDGIFNRIFDGDIVIMCSDGLYEMLDDDEILNIAKDNSLNLQEKTEKMVDRANELGGKDNISVILIA